MTKTTFIFFFILIVKLFADQEAPNKKYEKYSPNGKYVIEMIPSEDFGEDGIGKVYECNNKKKQKMLWKIDWYSYNVFIHNDGIHLVRFGPWASDLKNHTDLAFAFYNKDKLIKKYLVKDLVKKTNSLVYSVSHYTWVADKTLIKNGFSPDYSKYTVTMSDKNVYVFDILSGKIISNYIDKSARNFYELNREEKIRSKNSADYILKTSASFDVWKKYFEIKAEDKYATINDEGVWCGNLYPRKQYPYSIEIRADFTISKKGRVVIQISPQELITIMEQFIYLTPIKELLSSLGKHLVRIRVTSKMYNQNEFVAEDFRKLLLKNGIQCCSVNKWLQVIIDYNKHDMMGFLMPKNNSFVILDGFDSVPRIWKNKLKSDNYKREEADLLHMDADDYGASHKYTWENCTIIKKDGSLQLIKIPNHDK